MFYYLGDTNVTAEIAAKAIGATLPNLNTSILKGVVIRFPEIGTQRLIAGILSAYDDLIEVNTRRIAILEEMARRLFDEWFVKPLLRGGNADASHLRRTDPSEWPATTVGRICASLIDGDWIETKDQGGNDYRLLQVSNVGVGCFVETGNFRFITEQTFKRLRCTEVVPGDILIARMPKPTGRAWLVTEMPWRMITAVDIAIARANRELMDPYFLLYHLNSPGHLALVEKNQTGTTRPRISRSNLASLPLLLSPLVLQRRFGDFARTAYSLTTALQLTNANLRAARDLLLPRLISGEIDVSGAERQAKRAVKRAAAE